MRRLLILSLGLLLSFGASLEADVRLPQIFGNHMVLQQKAEAAIWGWADPGQRVVVEMAESRAETKADDQGRWMARLETPAAGGPYELFVVGGNTIKLTDVMVGEVWICSGQSNMEWSVARSNHPEKEISGGTHPRIRMIKVAKVPQAEPQDDISGGEWQVCDPDTVANFSAVGYFFARHLKQHLDVPVGMINTSWGGTVAEAWTSRGTLAADDDFQPILERSATFQPGRPNQASVLFNGMVRPLIPFTIRGAIWYQGESNVTRAEQYAKLFPAMITDWRKHWEQGDFPFYYVQLAPYRYGNRPPEACAELWEAQLKTLALPNTGMAVTTDIGNIRDIHPRNKQEVGRRLALWALANDYGKQIVHSGPLFKSFEVEGDKIRIHFTHTGGGLVAKGGEPLSHFQIAGEDKKFVEATARIDGDSVVVHSDQVSKPVAVRFAWTDTAEPNLFNQEGLPASPFRTDDFEMVTAGAR